jgi:hypothetical protein
LPAHSERSRQLILDQVLAGLQFLADDHLGEGVVDGRA